MSQYDVFAVGFLFSDKLLVSCINENTSSVKH